jgi:hypothetical protein
LPEDAVGPVKEVVEIGRGAPFGQLSFSVRCNITKNAYEIPGARGDHTDANYFLEPVETLALDYSEGITVAGLAVVYRGRGDIGAGLVIGVIRAGYPEEAGLLAVAGEG